MAHEKTRPAPSIHPRRNLDYMQQDCEMTLEEALAEYYTQIDNLITEDNAAPEVAQMFHYHDIVHVVFGCDTSLGGETLADTWAMAGTTVTLREYMKYLQLEEVKEMLAAFTKWEAFTLMLRSMPLMPRAWWRTRKMTKKWPYRENQQYAKVPLRQLREEFNIKVISLD